MRQFLIIYLYFISREKLAQAYDFALEKIGMDLHSYSIWSDYIQFLKSFEPIGSFAENQKITAIRKVYQKAVLTPIIGIEHLWKEYIQFEHNINPVISEKMSLERSRDYMNARRVAKELENVTKGLNRNLPAIPPTLTKEEFKQVSPLISYISTQFLIIKCPCGFRLNSGVNSSISKNQILSVVKTLGWYHVVLCFQLNSVFLFSHIIQLYGIKLLNILIKLRNF